MRCTQEVVPEMSSQRSAEENEYDGQQRSREGEAEEQGDNGRLD